MILYFRRQRSAPSALNRWIFNNSFESNLNHKFINAAVAGCTASFYPLALSTSADSSIDYSTNIRYTMAYNLIPYISIGFTFNEHPALNIAPANQNNIALILVVVVLPSLSCILVDLYHILYCVALVLLTHAGQQSEPSYNTQP